MAGLTYLGRAAAGEPEGLLVLHHGRGTEESDLLGLADVLDPGRRLRVVAPRAPLSLPGSPGAHWSLVPRVGHPDHDTFHAARDALAQLHDRLWEETGVGPERTVLGGFSMGSGMSNAQVPRAHGAALAGRPAFSRRRPGPSPSGASCRWAVAGRRPPRTDEDPGHSPPTPAATRSWRWGSPAG